MTFEERTKLIHANEELNDIQEQAYDKFFEDHNYKDCDYEIYAEYIPTLDMTIIFERCTAGENTWCETIIGFYYGEPNEQYTQQFAYTSISCTNDY